MSKRPPSLASRIYWHGIRSGISRWAWDHLTRDGREYWRNA